VEGIFAALSVRDRKTLGDTLAGAVAEAVGERTQGRFHAAVVLIDLNRRVLGQAGDLTKWQ